MIRFSEVQKWYGDYQALTDVTAQVREAVRESGVQSGAAVIYLSLIHICLHEHGQHDRKRHGNDQPPFGHGPHFIFTGHMLHPVFTIITDKPAKKKPQL